MMVQISAEEAAGKTRVAVEAQAEAASIKEKECKHMAALMGFRRSAALDAAVKYLNALKADIDEI